MDFHFKPIGIIHSCFTQKFGIPRQPGLSSHASATLELFHEYACAEAVRELTTFSHIWVVFVFHQNTELKWKPTVRPPRLGGNKRIGVFASRSGYRPNPIGISAVRLQGIESDAGKTVLHLGGVDLLDGTPVLDIKPYIPYADAIIDAESGYAKQAPPLNFDVSFSDAAQASCVLLEQEGYSNLRSLIVQLLATDTRPGYYEKKPSKNDFAMRLWDIDIQWRIKEKDVLVTGLERIAP